MRRWGFVIAILAVLSGAALFVLSRWERPCARYLEEYSAASEREPRVQLQSSDLSKRKGNAPPSPPKAYLDLGGLFLPVFEDEVKVQRSEEGAIGVLGPGLMLVAGGDAIQMQDPGAAAFLERLNIKTDYDFQSFLYSPRLRSCDGIETPADADAKAQFLKMKTAPAAMDVQEIYHSDSLRALIVTGVHKHDPEKKWAVHLLAQRDPKSSFNIMIRFKSRERQQMFVESLAHIRESEWFAQAVKLKIP